MRGNFDWKCAVAGWQRALEGMPGEQSQYRAWKRIDSCDPHHHLAAGMGNLWDVPSWRGRRRGREGRVQLLRWSNDCTGAGCGEVEGTESLLVAAKKKPR